MLRIAICDDNAEFSVQINSYLEQRTEVSCCIFDNGDDLITSHRKTPFDIIFLDVVMPMLNGIDTAKEIRQQDKNVKIIFLTSSAEFAIDAYRVKATDYLLKPVSRQKLMECVDDIIAEYRLKSETVIIKGIYAIHKISQDSIEYMESQNKHLVFHLQDGSTVETTEPMHNYSEKLTVNDGFFHCHRSYIVNMNHIQTYTANEIKMRSGNSIPISRSSHKEFQAAYFALLFGEAGETK